MLTTQTRYAIRALLYLAKQKEPQLVPVTELAAETNTPPAFLSKIVKDLSKNGIVYTKRGVNGGVRLIKRDISFYEIAEILDDPAVVDNCLLSREQCDLTSPCSFHEMWIEERGRLRQFLSNMRIQSQ